MSQRVAVGLSGGVDSSVSAALLVEQGYEVTGVYLTCWSGPGCRSEADRKDALDIALQLGIPFEHLDFQQAYKDKVYEYMIREYQAGRTPNPDVMCNREIKFGLFYDWAMAQGFDYVATGHYAQIQSRKSKVESLNSSENFRLMRSVDEHKDQTYFLYRLRQEQLEHILFPIGHLTKTQVREEAKKRGLLTAEKPDSVGVCFIGEVPMSEFLQERIKPKQGKIRIGELEVGTHKGVWFYTIGQKVAAGNAKNLARAGFDTRNLPHFYVVNKDVENNVLYVGTEDKLDTDMIKLGEVHWIGEKIETGLTVRIRHTGELFKVESLKSKGEGIELKLTKPVRGVAPGQAAVLYQRTRCVGGGEIG